MTRICYVSGAHKPKFLTGMHFDWKSIFPNTQSKAWSAREHQTHSELYPASTKIFRLTRSPQSSFSCVATSCTWQLQRPTRPEKSMAFCRIVENSRSPHRGATVPLWLCPHRSLGLPFRRRPPRFLSRFGDESLVLPAL